MNNLMVMVGQGEKSFSFLQLAHKLLHATMHETHHSFFSIIFFACAVTMGINSTTALDGGRGNLLLSCPGQPSPHPV